MLSGTMPGQYGRPAKAVFLTIDSAKVSGVALSEPQLDARGAFRGAYDCEAFCEVSSQVGREEWVREALEVARGYRLPLVIVGEEWTPHGLSRSAYQSLNESWGLWQAAIERERKAADVVYVVRVAPQSWRAAVFGKRRPKERKGLKHLAVLYAHKQLGTPLNLSDNIAEALCLRVWAERAGEVHAVLAPKKPRASSLKKPRLVKDKAA